MNIVYIDQRCNDSNQEEKKAFNEANWVINCRWAYIQIYTMEGEISLLPISRLG